MEEKPLKDFETSEQLQKAVLNIMYAMRKKIQQVSRIQNHYDESHNRLERNQCY